MAFNVARCFLVPAGNRRRPKGQSLFFNSSGSLALFAAMRSCLGQRHLAPELLQMRGHDGPSEGLRPLWCVKLDLERDPNSCQHATQHN